MFKINGLKSTAFLIFVCRLFLHVVFLREEAFKCMIFIRKIYVERYVL